MKAPTLLRSDELLTHFQCSSCGGGWSIGDFWKKAKDRPLWRLYCPWCGAAHLIGAPDEPG